MYEFCDRFNRYVFVRMLKSNESPLLKIIQQHIEAANGFLPFDVFMQHALYHESYGYYQQGNVFGEAGDFITGADMGPWLALGFADLIHQGWQQMGCPKQWGILEQGGGHGRLLSQVVRLLSEHFKQPPSEIFAVEKSSFWRNEQAKYYQKNGITVTQLAELNDVSNHVPLLIFSNELPDAFPVRCFVWQQGECFERGVTRHEGKTLAWCIAKEAMQPQPAIDPILMQTWPESYTSEFNPALTLWQQQLASLLAANGGMVFTLDYGYTQQEYYRPNRVEGSLMGHLGHEAVYDVLAQVGQADITAHVDFTMLARTGKAYGLTPLAYMTQGGWLASTPLVQSTLQEAAASHDLQSMKLISQAKRLMLPHAGMGESFKLLIQSSNGLALPPRLEAMNRLERLQLKSG